MANAVCTLKNIRPREMRGILPNNEYMYGEMEVELPLKYVIRAMHGSDVYINGVLMETFQQVVDVFAELETSTPEENPTEEPTPTPDTPGTDEVEDTI